MKRVPFLVVAGLLTTVAFAQQAPQRVTMVTGWRLEYGYLKSRYTQTAEAMPATDYAYKPLPSLKTFAQVVGHDVNAQFRQCAMLQGVPNPKAANDFEKVTTKAELIKGLNDSFALCDAAFAAATDQTLGQFVPQAMHGKPGKREEARGLILTEVIRHGSRGHSVMTLYLKLKGLDPPDPDRIY
jgi:DinB family protein